MEKTWNTFWETGRIDDYLEICREKESDREQEVRQNGAEPFRGLSGKPGGCRSIRNHRQDQRSEGGHVNESTGTCF